MRAIQVMLYSLEELDEAGQEKAFNDYCSENDYYNNDDNEKTLDAFTNIIPIEINDFEYGNYRPYVNFNLDVEDYIEDLKGQRLATYIYNNYYDSFITGKIFYKNNKMRISKIIKDPEDVDLTGYCLDYDILDPILKFLKKPDENITFNDLVEKCLDSWVNASNADYEYCFSMEAFKELSEANDYEYKINGEFV